MENLRTPRWKRGSPSSARVTPVLNRDLGSFDGDVTPCLAMAQGAGVVQVLWRSVEGVDNEVHCSAIRVQRRRKIKLTVQIAICMANIYSA